MANPIYGSENFSTTLNVGGGINDSQTTDIVLTSVSGLNTSGGMLGFTWASTIDTSTYEEIEYGGVSGNTLTGVIRGSGGTSAKSHLNGAVIVAVISKEHVNRLADKARSVDATLAQDPNNNEILKTGYNASAVNEVTITNAATANAPAITATGGDTNIDLAIAAKGSGNVKLGTAALKFPNADGSNGHVLQTNGSGTLSFAAASAASTDGWTTESATLTYASSSSVTTSGTVTAYTVGTRVKFTNNSITYYGTVASTSGSTINFVVNGDYTIANSAITAPSYSYTANPVGYPGWFNYTPTYGGFSVSPTGTGHARFSIVGRTCTVMKTQVTSGTSNATSFTMTLPVQCNAVAANPGIFLCRATDNGSTITTSNAYLTGGSSTLTFEKTAGGGSNWTGSGTKDAYVTLQYEI